MTILTSCNRQDESRVILSAYPNDSIKEVMYYDLPITADSIGTKEIYFENGKLQAKGGYKRGQRNGEWVCYKRNGQLEWKSKYVEGVENGTTECYGENGSWKKLTIINGCKQGPTEEYNTDGKANEAWVYGQYKDCKETGLWKWKDKKQRVVAQLWYNDGKPDKFYERIDTLGNIEQRAILHNGYLDTLYTYDKGKLIKTEAYKDKLFEMK